MKDPWGRETLDGSFRAEKIRIADKKRSEIKDLVIEETPAVVEEIIVAKPVRKPRGRRAI